jgi:hypothetical protein
MGNLIFDFNFSLESLSGVFNVLSDSLLSRFPFSGATCVFLLLNISLAVFLKFCGKSRFRGAVWEISPLLAWIFAITQLCLHLFLKGSVTPR